jgi:uncharacterized protein (DUF1800 family)
MYRVSCSKSGTQNHRGRMASCVVGALALALSACGGGSSSLAIPASTQSAVVAQQASISVSAVAAQAMATPSSLATASATGAVLPKVTQVTKPASRAEAARFLTQATFGPVDADVDHLMAVGYEAWLTEQLTAASNPVSHLNFWDRAQASQVLGILHDGGWPTESFWREALSSPDQLRQRVAFALSEIFVISNLDACGDNIKSRGTSGYMDMLGTRGFGSYRQLLESVALHPVMGCYLSHLNNLKEDVKTGREPDQNFAREVMQLFSIGLYQLNKDGSLKLDVGGQPIETYGQSDIQGMSKVFTGWAFYCADNSDNCWYGGRSKSLVTSVDLWAHAMQPFARYHSGSEKSFLGVTIPAQSVPDPTLSIKVALDTLAAHPNVGPFIGRQLIQRLVTSNPSAAYVARVSKAFDDAGGNLGAMVWAILMDPEARDMKAAMASHTFGKPKEPVLKLSALLRAYDARSTTGSYLLGYTEDPSFAMSQSPMRSPTVFNFFRPGFVLPGAQSAQAGLQTPEFQLLNETSVAGAANFLSVLIYWGGGGRGYDGTSPKPDVLLEYQRNDASSLLTLADYPAKLVEDVNQHLMYGTMSAGLKAEIVSTVAQLDYLPKTDPKQVLGTRQHRVWTALLLTMVSPEFQIQR